MTFNFDSQVLHQNVRLMFSHSANNSHFYVHKEVLGKLHRHIRDLPLSRVLFLLYNMYFGNARSTYIHVHKAHKVGRFIHKNQSPITIKSVVTVNRMKFDKAVNESDREHGLHILVPNRMKSLIVHTT